MNWMGEEDRVTRVRLPEAKDIDAVLNLGIDS